MSAIYCHTTLKRNQGRQLVIGKPINLDTNKLIGIVQPINTRYDNLCHYDSGENRFRWLLRTADDTQCIQEQLQGKQ